MKRINLLTLNHVLPPERYALAGKINEVIEEMNSRLEETTVEPAWPQHGDEYWYVDFEKVEMASRTWWEDDSSDHNFRETCGIYRTEEEAKDAAERMVQAVNSPF